MKILSLSLIIALLGTQPLFAQQPAAPTPADRLDLIPAEPQQDLPLIPEAPPQQRRKPRSEPIPQPEKKSKTEIVAEDMQERVRFRQVKTRALSDPALAAQWDRAQAAKTDPAKREGLKRYYSMLFARMEKLDPSLKKKLATEKALAFDLIDHQKPTSGFHFF